VNERVEKVCLWNGRQGGEFSGGGRTGRGIGQNEKKRKPLEGWLFTEPGRGPTPYWRKGEGGNFRESEKGVWSDPRNGDLSGFALEGRGGGKTSTFSETENKKPGGGVLA